MSKTYDAAYWDGVRAEREASERAERQAYGEAARASERLHLKLDLVAKLERAIKAADAQAAQYREPTESARINGSYYRGKAQGIEDALAILRGALVEAEREAGR